MSFNTPVNDKDEAKLRLASWALHFYTAMGAVVGVMAINAALEGRALLCLRLMLLTIFIDGTDGFLARRLKVWQRLPQIDGRRLDDIVDYFTYVIVPAIAMVQLELIPNSVFIWAPILMASALGFANVAAKTEDDYFLGFPSYWNLIAIYLYFLHFPLWLNSLLVLALAGGVFAPIGFIYPSKTRPFRKLTISLGLAWTLQIFLLLCVPQALPSWWLGASLIFPIYYFSMSIYLQLHR